MATVATFSLSIRIKIQHKYESCLATCSYSSLQNSELPKHRDKKQKQKKLIMIIVNLLISISRLDNGDS